MPEDEQHSLSDEQIKCDYRKDPGFLTTVMRELAALERRIAEAGDCDEVAVPLEALQTIRMALRAFIKGQSEVFIKDQSEAFPSSVDHGNQGADCDYNPFIRINTGDLFPVPDISLFE